MSNIIISGDTSGAITVQPAASGSGNITLPSVSGTLISSTTLAAGTVTQAPLTFTSGNVQTTAAAGSWEYDGVVSYQTPQSTQRGLLPATMLYFLNNNRTLANDASIQNIFNVSVTLSSNTVYQMEAQIAIWGAGAIASIQVLLGFGGTATVNNILYDVPYLVNSGTGSQVDSTPVQTVVNTVNMTALSNAGSSETHSITLRGTVSINTGGTFIPQMQYSAIPTIVESVIRGSWFCFTPVGAAGANVSIGTWA